MSAQRPARAPGYVNAAAALTLLLVVAIFAFRVAQASPPAIAEFAPQAQQVKQAPPEQTSAVGNGPGGAASGSSVPSPTPSAAGVPAGATFLHCIGDPPRQIEDPQSPPCVPYWVGNNGGATSRGVFSNRIRIFSSAINDFNNEPSLFAFFNRRFELYGRTLEFHANDGPNAGGAGDEAGETADAEQAYQDQSFAADTYATNNGFWFYNAAAKKGIVVASGYPVFTEAYMQQMQPYVWQYPPGLDREWSDLGSWICKQLAGYPAVHAGDPTMHTQKRVFGVYLDQETELSLTDTALETQLHACGSGVAYFFRTDDTRESNQDVAQADAGAVVAFRQNHVTDVICLCLDFVYGALLAGAASNQGYEPEWILTSYFGGDVEAYSRGDFPHDQLAHAFGVGFYPKQHPEQSDPSAWAEEEEGHTPPADSSDDFETQIVYRDLLLIASGVQMAGPHLTPQTFQEGLWRALFPNPPGPPPGIGAVGFQGDVHGMVDTGTEFWWTLVDRGPNQEDAGAGAVCYVNHGQRFRPGEWPSGTPADGSARDPYFVEPCDTGAADG